MADDGGQEGQGAKRVRGPSTLKFLDALRPGQRFQVESWLNTPIGPNSVSMSTYVSHLAKDGNKLPLSISKWVQMPAEYIENAILDVKKVFDYPDDLDDWVRTKLHDRWKSHKHIAKKEGFYKYDTLEERLAHRPKDVLESQWGPLIEYWQNPQQDAICAKSRANKAKQTVHQSSGPKPYVKYVAELEAKLKRPPTAQEIFDATHARRKKQTEALENKPSQDGSGSSLTRQIGAILQLKAVDCTTPVSSSKKRKMNAEDSGSCGIKTVCRNKSEHLPLSRSNSIQEHGSGQGSDEEFGLVDNLNISKEMVDGTQEEQTAKKVRGPGTLKFLDTLRPGQRLPVESWLNSPIGPNSTYMCTYVSHLAKDGNKFPLTITHWNRMPAVFVLKAMLEVKKVFDYPDDLDDWIRAKLHDRWKSHKHIAKKEGFYKYNTLEERLAHRPKDVVESQWGPLIEYWQNPRHDAICAKRKANNSKQKVRHRGGSKPHVKYAAELEAKLKRPPTAQEIFDATYARGKKRTNALKNRPSLYSFESSSTRQNGAILQLKAEDCTSPVSSSKSSIPTSPLPLVQDCVTEDNENMEAESDESLESSDNEDNTQADSDKCLESSDDEDNMQVQSDEWPEGFNNEDHVQAVSDESPESFRHVVKPVEAARTTSTAQHVDAAKMTSSAKSPTVDSAPFIEPTSVSGRGSDDEFELVDNFKIPKEYAVLYKKIYEKYGHMATRKVIKSNDTILVASVASLLKIISTMETVRGADLNEALLESWDGDIEDVENLGFNITWLRERFNEVKNNWNSSSGIRKEVEIHEKELGATQAKYVDLLARKEQLQRETSEVIIQIRKAEAKISSEKKAIQVKLAPEKNFMCEPVLGKVLS